MTWIHSSIELPREYEYVLCWLPNRPWKDRDPREWYRAKVMCRRPYDMADCRGPGWVWDEFGPGTARPDEVSHWQPIVPPQ